MITTEDVRKLALAFDGVEEIPHVELISFRVNKKIFATLDLKNKRACLKFNSSDQSVFCSFDPEAIYPVPNKWGLRGATYVELGTVREDLFKNALTASYCRVAPKKSAAKYESNDRLQKAER
ncbi:MAG: MmcQ/YjbR family DNA-binding protein [Bacteroidia bacterium]